MWILSSGQLQLLRFWNDLEPSDQLSLVEQVLCHDLINLNNLFKDARVKRSCDIKGEIVHRENTASTFSSSAEERGDWKKLGMEAISKCEVGVILLSGGQATRLEADTPKALFDIGLQSRKTLLQIQAEKIQKLESLAGGKLFWYIMTSEATNDAIMEALENSSYFGMNPDQVKIFSQGTLPCYSDEGDILLENQSTLATSPDGNGGLLIALKDECILADMKLKKLKHLFVYSVDNVLVKIADPEFLGYCISKDADCGNKVNKVKYLYHHS